MTNPINLPDHARARLPLEHGEELLIVLPVESQPKPDTKRLLPDLFGDGKWYRVFDTPTGEHVSLIDGHDPPHRLGDVLEVNVNAGPRNLDVGPLVVIRLTVQRVECKRVRELTETEARAAGFVPRQIHGEMWQSAYSYASQFWTDDRGPDAWERDWVWMVWAKSGDGRRECPCG